MKRVLCAFVSLSLLFGLQNLVKAAYVFTTIDGPAGSTYTAAFKLNDAGQTVGTYTGRRSNPNVASAARVP